MIWKSDHDSPYLLALQITLSFKIYACNAIASHDPASGPQKVFL